LQDFEREHCGHHGASADIGRATALAFARPGADVALSGVP
jgi:NAD(P)-dependent dehydrogenase (short-subunit alcohol dehydrogenase family)